MLSKSQLCSLSQGPVMFNVGSGDKYSMNDGAIYSTTVLRDLTPSLATTEILREAETDPGSIVAIVWGDNKHPSQKEATKTLSRKQAQSRLQLNNMATLTSALQPLAHDTLMLMLTISMVDCDC